MTVEGFLDLNPEETSSVQELLENPGHNQTSQRCSANTLVRIARDHISQMEKQLYEALCWIRMQPQFRPKLEGK